MIRSSLKNALSVWNRDVKSIMLKKSAIFWQNQQKKAGLCKNYIVFFYRLHQDICYRLRTEDLSPEETGVMRNLQAEVNR